ncbi:SBBP repeat-containing protein, partial [Candidatus Eisenbacteria bacterium]
WSHRFGDVLSQWVYGITVDDANNVIIAGHFHGTVNFGGAPLSDSGLGDIFLAKYDSDGNHLWSQRFGDGGAQTGYGVAVDAAGNILLTGEFSGNVDFGGGQLTTHVDVPDVFVAKFDPNGNHLWSHDFGDLTHHQTAKSIVVDAAGNADVIGQYEGNIDFGGGPLPTAADGQSDMFLVQLDPSGAHVWSRGFAATTDEMFNDLAIGYFDCIYVTGTFAGDLDLGGGPLTSAGWDVFLALFDAGGALLWNQRFGDAAGQQAYSVVVDGTAHTDYAYLTGQFAGSVDFGGGPLTSAGSTDVFLAQFDWNGNHIWSDRFGDSAYQIGHDLASSEPANCPVTNRFSGSVDFGGSTLECAGGTDIFVAKFGDPGSQGFMISEYNTVFDDPSYILVEVQLHNNGPGTAYDVITEISESVSWLQITDPDCYYGDIPEGESAWGEDGDSFGLYLEDGYPGGGFDVLLHVWYQDSAGSSNYVQLEVTIDPNLAGVGDSAEVMPAAVRLLPNWPNPFNPSTSIPFELAEPGCVSLRIFDIGGRLVRTLVDDRLAGDSHVAVWNGRDDQGGTLPSGAYFYSLHVGERTLTRKLVIVQ